jgi:CDP-diacylglycerol--glycerol-3-phosphate 3-phosphatidyltransferase
MTTTASFAQPTAPLSAASEDVRTWANAVTLIRVVAGTALFTVALLEHSMVLSLAGLAVYGILDGLDGFLARRLHQETRFGAQIDILADRQLIAFFYWNYLSLHPQATIAIVLYLLEFAVLDQYLSNQFMRWPILSPNYFYVVDRTIWLLNWSAPGKFLNSGMVTLLLLITGSVWAVVPVVVALYCIKLYSAVRLHRLPSPGR